MEKEKFIENRGEIVLYQPDANITMEVRLDATFDTVWLNRQQMAELFERDVKTIGKHINNALSEELAGDSFVANNTTTKRKTENPTVANFAIVQKEGERMDPGGSMAYPEYPRARRHPRVQGRRLRAAGGGGYDWLRYMNQL